MVASQVHLVRHGEVFNPDGILYGRLSGFGLSKLGHRMAQAAADELVARKRPVVAVASSSLQRARESAAPIAAAFGLDPVIEDRVIEPRNRFEGTVAARSMRLPSNWPWLVNPWRPSWGEPYSSIAERMRAAVNDAFDSLEAAQPQAAQPQAAQPEAAQPDGAQPEAAQPDATAGEHAGEPRDAVLISHQLPIWVLHLSLTGERFLHDPRKRRCSLSSITTFERHNGELVEVGYSEPARLMQENATDVGAV